MDFWGSVRLGLALGSGHRRGGRVYGVPLRIVGLVQTGETQTGNMFVVEEI